VAAAAAVAAEIEAQTQGAPISKPAWNGRFSEWPRQRAGRTTPSTLSIAATDVLS